MNWGSRNSGDLGAITDAFADKFDKEGDSSGFLWEEESSSFSGCHDSPLIDLKLGNVHNSEETAIFSSSESVAGSKKKVRAVVASNQIAYCQVYGCNKDLSSSKDYHKRHKVCDVHSKTSKVIVNGIEQRFCQQCSRFHLLGEFDEGKRSCRKRLAGHNERRRKPQFCSNSHQGRAARLLSPYYDGRLHGNALSTPFIYSDILHDNTLVRPIKYGRNGYYGSDRSAQDDNANNYSLIPANSFQYQQLQPRLPFPDLFEKKPSLSNTGYTSSLGITFTGGQYQEQEGGESNSSDRSIFITTTTAPAFDGISDSGCALSLLSSQSRNSLSSGIPIGEPRYSITTNQDKHNLVTVVSNGGVFVQGSGFNVKDQTLASSVEDGATIDLLQLSSKLQQVQQQQQRSLSGGFSVDGTVQVGETRRRHQSGHFSVDDKLVAFKNKLFLNIMA